MYKWMIGLFLLMVGCTPETVEVTRVVEVTRPVEVTRVVVVTATPDPLPPAFVDRANALLDSGAGLVGAADTGVSFTDFRRALGEVNGDYDALLAVWPDGVPPGSRASFDKALQAWGLALFLWELDIGDYDPPTEPDINRYEQFAPFAVEGATHPDTHIVEEYRGRQYVPFDNVGVLMGIAADAFNEGRGELLGEIE